MKKFLGRHKIKTITLILLAFVFAGVLIFVKNDHFLYRDAIIKVLDVQEEAYEDDSYGTLYDQKIKAIVMNGENKNELVNFKNIRTYSGMGVRDYNIKPGDELIVHLGDLDSVEIIDFKRDFYVALELLIFCYILILVASKKSILILASAVVNTAIFILIMWLREKSVNIFLLFVIGAVVFTVVTLWIIGGYNKKPPARSSPRLPASRS